MNINDKPMKKSYVELEKENKELRKEVGTLRLVNLDCARTNEGLLEEHKQLIKLRSKIDKAIEELQKEIEENHLNVIEYADTEWITKDFVYGAIERFKRNIGE